MTLIQYILTTRKKTLNRKERYHRFCGKSTPLHIVQDKPKKKWVGTWMRPNDIETAIWRVQETKEQLYREHRRGNVERQYVHDIARMVYLFRLERTAPKIVSRESVNSSHHDHNVNRNGNYQASFTSGSSLAPRLSASRTSIFFKRTTPNSTSGNSSSASPCTCIQNNINFRGRNNARMGKENQL